MGQLGTVYCIQPTSRQQKKMKRTQKEQSDVIRYAEFQAKKRSGVFTT